MNQLLLDVAAGPDAGRVIEVPPGRHVVGRSHSAAIRLDDPDVEPHHVLLDVASDLRLLSVTQLAGRHATVADGDGRTIELGGTLLRRRPHGPARQAPAQGWVELGVACGPELHRDPDSNDGSGTIHAELMTDRHNVVGLVDAAGDRRLCVTMLRSIVAQLAVGDPTMSVVDLLSGSEPVVAALSMLDQPGRQPGRQLVVTDQPGLVRGGDSPVQALVAAGHACTVIVATVPRAPVLGACHAVIEIGPRCRARWYPSGDQAPCVRLHAAGVSVATAIELLAGAGRTLVAE